MKDSKLNNVYKFFMEEFIHTYQGQVTLTDISIDDNCG